MSAHVIATASEVVSYDYSYSHQAIDIVGPNNTIDDIIAYDDGVVEMVVNNFYGTDNSTYGTATYGNFVKIRHSNGQKTLYAHLEYGTVCVSVGQTVSKGQVIGRMGASGNAYGAHLHFEIRNSDESRENPNDYLYKPVLEISNYEDTVEAETVVETYETPKEEYSNEYIDVSNIETTISEDNNYEEDTIYNNYDTFIEDYDEGSIVDNLKINNIDSSYDSREEIALLNDIEDYQGTYDQNVYMLELLNEGQLNVE